MVSIPVALTEEEWRERKQVAPKTNITTGKAVINFIPSTCKKRRGRPVKPKTPVKEGPINNSVSNLVPCIVQSVGGGANNLVFTADKPNQTQIDNYVIHR